MIEGWIEQELINEIRIQDIPLFYNSPVAWLGYTVVGIYSTKEVMVHESFCTSDPTSIVSVRASNMEIQRTSRFWFTINKYEAMQKVLEFVLKGYSFVHCTSCNP